MIVCNPARIMRDRQLTIRRQFDQRGIALKALALDAGIPQPTLQSYFPTEGTREPAVIPMSAVYCLAPFLPADLMTLLLPDGFAIVRVPEAMDHCEVAEAMQDYLCAKSRAHRADSPGGAEIAPCEDADLRTKLAAVPGGKA